MHNKWLQTNKQSANKGAENDGENSVQNELLRTCHHVEPERNLVLVISQQDVVGHLGGYGDARLPMLISR